MAKKSTQETKKEEKLKEEKISPKTEEKEEETKDFEALEAQETPEPSEESESEDEGKKDKKDEMIDELKDKLLRAQAEFENFRRRSENEKSQMYTTGAMSTLEKIIPVVDNFERGLDSADDSPFAEGIKMIYKQLMTALEDMGVTPIKAMGETFDPEYHNAVMHEDNPDAGESEITQELQKGYMYQDRVLRHSMVKVAN